MKQTPLLLLLFTLLFTPLFSQLTPLSSPAKQAQAISLDWLQVKSIAEQAPHEDVVSDMRQAPTIQLKDLQGVSQTYYVLESPIMSTDFAQQYPDFHTYILKHVSDPNLTGRMMTTAEYMHVVLLDGSGIIQIRPDDLNNPQSYSIGTFDDPNESMTSEEFCGQWGDVDPEKRELPQENPPSNRNTGGFTNELRRTYNLAVVTTGEFHDANGATVAAATAVVTASVNAIQAIYDRELSIRFTLLTPVVYTDYLADPFDPTSATSRTLQAANGVGMNFASGTYDIGHVFHDQDQGPGPYFGGGGVAGLGVVCNSFATGVGSGLQKGRGWSGSFNNTNSSWYRLAAHEFGHMFDANHTFNGSGSSCTTGNISSSNSYEIGSGTTIMSYRNICSAAQNVPSSGEDDHYFHSNSLDEMIDYITTSGTCATTTVTGNTAPVGNASPSGMTYTIPGQTPFSLTGSASDVDGDALTYCWEQFDEDGAGSLATQGFIGATAAASAIAPLFRSYPPSTSPTRTFPEISNILAGTNTGLDFEALPSVSRTLNFVLTIRDNNANGGGVHCSATTVAVDASTGPFAVSSQNTATSWTANGANTAIITWDVAGTTGGSVNAATVDILFSDDGGNTFPYTLASATANDGSEVITIPSYPTFSGRIKVQGTNNIFFDINNADITISSSCPAEGTTFSPGTDVSAQEGDASLNLTLTADYGTQITSYSGTLESTDPASSLAVENNGGGTCINFGGNATVYDLYTFRVNQSDTYTFTFATGSSGRVVNLYQGSYSSGSPCTNWLASSGNFNGASVNLGASVGGALVPGVEYTLMISSFSATTPTLPSNYTINVTSAGSGDIYDGTPNPGGAYSYTYVIVDNGTGNIAGIDAGADLSNSLTYPDAIYTVRGLSYLSTENLAPYVGGAYSSLESDIALLVICGNISDNFITVTITANPLPVEYLDFTAQSTDLDQVQLSWTTVNELNNDFFEIERQVEGGEFLPIGKVNGAGSSEDLRKYTFLDASPTQITLWYRLKQVDFDGTFSYSEIREVSLSGKREQYLLYPNPTQSLITIVPPAMLLEEDQHIYLYDLQGKLVFSEKVLGGEATIELELGDLPDAMYMVRIVSERGKSSWIKVMKES